MNCPYCIKVCSKCGKLLVANNMNFYKYKRGKYKLRGTCKRCMIKKSKEYRENNPEYLKKYYENNKEYIKEKNKEYYEDNKKYYKEWRENNKEHRKEYYKEYYKDNKEHRNKKDKEWRENNPDKVFNKHHKRRLLKESQGNGISKEQWLEMMEFFEFKCAYSGITLSKNTRTIDHIIPLSKGGEHEIWNLVPMHRNYNSSKFTNDMLEWYQQQDFYSEERLNKIYEWIEYAKNKWENSNK